VSEPGGAAWIGGVAFAGPLAIALVALAVFWVRNRRKG
jgi:hypothetical protein